MMELHGIDSSYKAHNETKDGKEMWRSCNCVATNVQLNC